MKIIAYFGIFLTVCLMAGCAAQRTSSKYWSSDPWSDYDFHNQAVDTILDPNAPNQSANYRTPKKYVVTEKEEQNFQHLNARIQERISQVHQKSQTGGTDVRTSDTQAAPDTAAKIIQHP